MIVFRSDVWYYRGKIMEKGNVLVVGYAGVGKSTLIRTVLGDEAMKKPCGGKTKVASDFQVYENKGISFRLIDTVGLEPGLFSEFKAVNAVKKWAGETIKNKDDEHHISAVWFCVDRFTVKIFPKTIDSLMKAISMWKNVPIIVVITQSYKGTDTKEAQDIVEKAFLSKNKYATRLTEIVSVVAKPYTEKEGVIEPPKGITELIELTNSILPEGYQAAEKDIARYNLARRRAMSHAVVSAATLAGITVGGGAMPIADAMLLKPTEALEIEAISKIWGIKKTKKTKEFIDYIIDIGTKGTAGKMLASGLKMIPGLNLGAAVINAFIAGAIVFAMGEVAAYIFEQIYTGKQTMDDVTWVKEVLEDKMAKPVVDKVSEAVENVPEEADDEELQNIILDVFTQKKTA